MHVLQYVFGNIISTGCRYSFLVRHVADFTMRVNYFCNVDGVPPVLGSDLTTKTQSFNVQNKIDYSLFRLITTPNCVFTNSLFDFSTTDFND